jgi:hypothetical protein
LAPPSPTLLLTKQALKGCKNRIADFQASPVERKAAYPPERILAALARLEGLELSINTSLAPIELAPLASYHQYYASEAMFYVLQLSIHDKPTAHEKYLACKDLFLDERTHLWRCFAKDRSGISEFRTCDQFFTILVESVFDKAKANGQYQHLLRSPLKKQDAAGWYYAISPRGERVKCPTDYEVQVEQLVCQVLTQHPALASGHPPLPKVRNF